MTEELKWTYTATVREDLNGNDIRCYVFTGTGTSVAMKKYMTDEKMEDANVFRSQMMALTKDGKFVRWKGTTDSFEVRHLLLEDDGVAFKLKFNAKLETFYD